MAALDEFVTRAQSQNNSHQTKWVEGLKKAVSNAQEGFNAFEKTSAESILALENFGNEYKAQTADLDDIVASLGQETRLPLGELMAELSNAHLKEYVPTGQTPQKKEWNYPNQLPQTENHESIIARLRGLPDPAIAAKTPSTARTPARSARKQASLRKAPSSPSKLPSPSKTKVFTDVVEPPTSHPSTFQGQTTTSTIPLDQVKASLKEININVLARPGSSSASASASHSHQEKERPVLLDFSKSVGSAGGMPPLKRHATTNAVVESKLPAKLGRAKSSVAGVAVGVENFSQSVGPLGGGRRLRSSPPE